jgi:hypothetical protein
MTMHPAGDVVETVRSAFAREPQLPAPEVRVSTVGESEVLLSGILDTESQRALACEIATRAAPSVTVTNGLTLGASRRHIQPECRQPSRQNPKNNPHRDLQAGICLGWVAGQC